MAEKEKQQYCKTCEAYYLIMFDFAMDAPPVCCAFCGSSDISETDDDTDEDEDETDE